MTYPSSKRARIVLSLIVCLIQAKSLVRFTVAKMMRRTDVNANIAPTITPTLEDVGSVSMIKKTLINKSTALTIMGDFACCFHWMRDGAIFQPYDFGDYRAIEAINHGLVSSWTADFSYTLY